jgi:hypothetical protein
MSWSPSRRCACGARGVAATPKKRHVPLKAGEIIELIETDDQPGARRTGTYLPVREDRRPVRPAR